MSLVLRVPPPLLESRQTVGLRSPRSVSRNVHPAAGGLSVHHGGGAQQIPATALHTGCRARVRAWQDYHMNPPGQGGHGWVDLAYNWVVCQHGIVMVGRGLGVRSAANGTNDSNDRYLACCWLGGAAEVPTTQARSAIAWLVGEIRRRGAGHDVRPHRFFFPTSCPGDLLATETVQWAAATILEPSDTPTSVVSPAFPLPRGQYFGPRAGGPNSISGYCGHRSDLAHWQAKVGRLLADGLYGPRTAARVREFQAAERLQVDGLVGPRTWQRAWA